MLSNAYFLAKFRFDTAENEPAKNLQNFRKCIFEKCIFEKCILEFFLEALKPTPPPEAELVPLAVLGAVLLTRGVLGYR